MVQKAVDIALESDWFGLPIAELEEAPDPSFVYRDDLAVIDVFSFLSDPDFDMFSREDE